MVAAGKARGGDVVPSVAKGMGVAEDDKAAVQTNLLKLVPDRTRTRARMNYGTVLCSRAAGVASV